MEGFLIGMHGKKGDKMDKKKKISSVIIAVMMLLTMIPSFAFATNDGVEKNDASSQMLERPVREASGEKEAPLPKINKNDSQIETYSFGPNTVSGAETDVAEVNGLTYTSLQAAIDASSIGDTITLLKDTNESIYIDKEICLDLNEYIIITDQETDVIAIDASDVVIKNGYVCNVNYQPTDHATAIFINDNASAVISDVSAMTVGGEATDNISSAFYIAEGAYGVFDACEVYYDDEFVTDEDLANCAYIEELGYGSFIDCSFETLYGDGCYINGDADFETCYFATQTTGAAALSMGPDASTAIVYSGYYYGDAAVWVDEDCYGEMLILEGEFHNADTTLPAFEDPYDVAQLYNLDGRDTMAIPTDWKTGDEANHVYICEEVPAPDTVKANLTAQYGATNGFDDIKVTWSESSNADGYGISYKKGSGNYIDYQDYDKADQRSCVVKNLSDGYKYTFMVNPYVLVNEEILDDGGTMCYSDSYKTAYTYTLKKISTPKVKKSGSKVKVSWTNINGETGYQISKSTKKKGTSIVSTYKTTSGKSKVIKATKGKTYYYKVRAYKVVDGKKIYGPWSSVKKFKR